MYTKLIKHLVLVVVMSSRLRQVNCDFHLTILHTSDVTAAFEQFNPSGEECSQKEQSKGHCLGGVARRATVIKEIKKDSDVLLLDAGDQFVGEWFSVYRGNATSYFMNELGYDAMTFGNREFALGPDNLASFLTRANFDAISTNLNATGEPRLQKVVKKSVIKHINGDQVGLVGYTVERTNKIALLRNASFENVQTALQKEVNALKKNGVNKIIVVGHSYGRIESEDNEVVQIARNVDGVDVIVLGGALLFQCNDCPFEQEDRIASYSHAPYPIAYTTSNDGKVLLVHGYLDGRYIGQLDVVFDDEGKVTKWGGNPIRLDNNVEQDPEMLAKVAKYAKGVEEALDKVLGDSRVTLDGGEKGRLVCRQGECNMGNFITDAMLWNFRRSTWNGKWKDVSMAVMHGGGIRASIRQGHILMRDIVNVMPFSNTVDAVEIKGEFIREMLENSVAKFEEHSGAFLQVAGLQVSYDITRQPYFNRVVDVKVSCTECEGDSYVPLDDEKLYKIAIPSYIGNGGDGYDMIRSNADEYHTGDIEEDVIAKYIEQFSPLETKVEGRIFVAKNDPEPEVVTKPFYKKMAIFGIICLAVLIVIFMVVAGKVLLAPIIKKQRQLKYMKQNNEADATVDAEAYFQRSLDETMSLQNSVNKPT